MSLEDLSLVDLTYPPERWLQGGQEVKVPISYRYMKLLSGPLIKTIIDAINTTNLTPRNFDHILEHLQITRMVCETICQVGL